MSIAMRVGTTTLGHWTATLREGAVAGSLATVLSIAVLATAGRRRDGAPAAPVNAVSHWLWGERSLRADDVSLRYTGIGYVTHHLAAVFWAALYSWLYGHRSSAKRALPAIAGAVATSAVAYTVDYAVVPQRLTPGYEHRLGRGALLATYGALAAGFALGALLLGAREGR